MTPKQLLSVWWSSQGFFAEALASFLLVFLVLIFIFLTKAFKIKHQKLFLSATFTLATFVMYIQVWSASKYSFNSSPTPIGNPIFVFMQSVLQGFKFRGRTYSFDYQYKGIAYLIAGEFFGFILALGAFLVLFCPMKRYLSKINTKNKEIKSLTLIDVFKKEEPTVLGYALKEAIFIIIFCFALGYIFYIQNPQYGLSNYDVIVALSVVVFVLILVSSYFGFFAFNIFIDLFISAINLIYGIFATKTNIHAIKKPNFYQNDYSIYSFHMLISSALTIVIPFIVSFISIGIYQLTKGDGLNF
ncbi:MULTISPECIES: MAG4940 family membrane protein [unclassified Mycoplasma]|uniref:MAG4940 family membrane protein n=1 Tax=unclassified Mycoplasma TaxID=2683645 RepID=UPI00211C42AD|nr:MULTISPECIES: hypothetical protein [unclassified Mycoplasma]UUM20138.1 hypothetical protein NPA11_01795 [Mycoplasma sp. 1578d]UUM25118.1 hypothetical protein NPA12_01770 [Mycoplasma sp. 3686d]